MMVAHGEDPYIGEVLVNKADPEHRVRIKRFNTETGEYEGHRVGTLRETSLKPSTILANYTKEPHTKRLTETHPDANDPDKIILTASEREPEAFEQARDESGDWRALNKDEIAQFFWDAGADWQSRQ